MGVIRFLLNRAAPGWLAGQVMKGLGFGVLGNMMGGGMGTLVGGFIFGFRGGDPEARLGADALRRSVDWERRDNRPWHSGGRRPVGAHTSCSTVVSFTRAATLGLLVLVTVLLGPRPLAAAPVPVRFVEGATHGFLVLRTVDGVLLASGDLLQVGPGRRGREPHGVPLQGRVVIRRDGGIHPAARLYHAELPPGAARARIRRGH